MAEGRYRVTLKNSAKDIYDESESNHRILSIDWKQREYSLYLSIITAKVSRITINPEFLFKANPDITIILPAPTGRKNWNLSVWVLCQIKQNLGSCCKPLLIGQVGQNSKQLRISKCLRSIMGRFSPSGLSHS